MAKSKNKSASLQIGATFHDIKTGKIYKWNGKEWIDIAKEMKNGEKQE